MKTEAQNATKCTVTRSGFRPLSLAPSNRELGPTLFQSTHAKVVGVVQPIMTHPKLGREAARFPAVTVPFPQSPRTPAVPLTNQPAKGPPWLGAILSKPLSGLLRTAAACKARAQRDHLPQLHLGNPLAGVGNRPPKPFCRSKDRSPPF